ncbi:hypothetical protein BC939DRAFT_475151 [Gamsiella multidivaricata]|uniref:uncharacterized protein n=1 Tax=Gamsiella multidivaricata TaxID=101098 RepID=UPI00222106EB|nr:uncharacterized protein BC939DRAFT_475151 [Gamsiella multidivaricata]KAI7827548.1 hypothetical protein BC939DRAFT_475151 [Gamsiella multidivaricata]
MNTSRPSSRNQNSVNQGTVAAPVRRAKIASSAQISISSAAFPPKTGSLPASSTVTPTKSSRGSSFNQTGNNGYPTISANSTSNKTTNPVVFSSNPNSNSAPPRLVSVRTRSSNSVATVASFRSTNGTSSGGSGGGSSNNRQDGGSTTSDDGTVSEDSDRAGEDMQLFTGGQAGVGGGINLPFGSSGRNPTSTGSVKFAAGPGVGGLNRHRTSSSTVGLSSGDSTTPSRKPVRIAAGAFMRIDSAPNHQSGYASTSSSHSTLGISNSSSTTGALVGTSNPSHTTSASMPSWTTASSASSLLGGNPVRNGYPRNGDEGSIVSMSSAVSSSTPTIRSTKVNSTGTTTAAVANLEISNASLLSINQSLEATIRKQASEVQELKLRMQSTHFGELGYTAADLVLAQSVEAIELTDAEKQDDLTFKRLCLSIDQMVYEAKLALDQATKPTGVKVLTLHDMFEKEVAEEAEEEEEEEKEEEEEEIESIDADVQDGQDEALEQVESQNQKRELDIRDGNADRDVLPPTLDKNMIPPALLETPLSMPSLCVKSFLTNLSSTLKRCNYTILFMPNEDKLVNARFFVKMDVSQRAVVVDVGKEPQFV